MFISDLYSESSKSNSLFQNKWFRLLHSTTVSCFHYLQNETFPIVIPCCREHTLNKYDQQKWETFPMDRLSLLREVWGHLDTGRVGREPGHGIQIYIMPELLLGSKCLKSFLGLTYTGLYKYVCIYLLIFSFFIYIIIWMIHTQDEFLVHQDSTFETSLNS